jgi:hypothetical protein
MHDLQAEMRQLEISAHWDVVLHLVDGNQSPDPNGLIVNQ